MQHLAHFEQVLTQIFEEVEPDFRKHQIELFRATAKFQYETWMKRLELPLPEEKVSSSIYGRMRSRIDRGEYVGKESRPGSDIYRSDNKVWWAEQQTMKDLFFPDYKKAEADANWLVTGAKTHFIAKQSKKLENACKNKTEKPKVSGKLILGSVISGHLHVEFPKTKDSFQLNMSIIFNNRQGRYFPQFPSRFAQVKKGGVSQTAKISEAWMKGNF